MYRGLSRLMLARRVGLLGPANGFRARGTQGRARSVLCRRSKSDGPAAEEKPPAEEGGGTNNNNGGSPPPKSKSDVGCLHLRAAERAYAHVNVFVSTYLCLSIYVCACVWASSPPLFNFSSHLCLHACAMA